MNCSESNISEILRKGLDSGAFTSHALRASLVGLGMSSPSLTTIDVNSLIMSKSRIIMERIGMLGALTLHRDNNLHKGKEYFQLLYQDTPTAYVISRLLIEELKHAFAFKFTDRNSLLSELGNSFFQFQPDTVIRTDIKSFFESVCHRILFEILESNPKISKFSLVVYKKIFEEFERHRLHNSMVGYGLPRGLAISSYLAEIYLLQIDSEIKNIKGISFYGRYVDDIMVLCKDSVKNDEFNTFNLIKGIFKKRELDLHKLGDGKSSIVKISNEDIDIGNYLGYSLSLNHAAQKIEFKLPPEKIKRKLIMVDKAFSHFEKVSRTNVKQARRDLIDCLNMLSSNFSLSGSKKDIRTGIFYTNQLLTDLSGLDCLTEYVRSKSLLPYKKSFLFAEEYLKYIFRLGAKIESIDFRENWISRKMVSLSPQRISRLKAIMKSDTKGDWGVKAFNNTTHMTPGL